MASNKTFGKSVVDYHFSMNASWSLPENVELLYPFRELTTQKAFESFYKKYFNDTNHRHFLFGINPGRFGAGITGVPFTDPKILAEKCEIDNPFQKKNELSAIFVYEFVEALGGIDTFYKNFYITSVCPLGFVKDGKNYNYYDDKQLYAAVETKIVSNIQTQMKFGCYREKAFCMGKGKNMKYFTELNKKHGFFNEIVPLPHPRWVMQYKLKSKSVHIDKYVLELSLALDSRT